MDFRVLKSKKVPKGERALTPPPPPRSLRLLHSFRKSVSFYPSIRAWLCQGCPVPFVIQFTLWNLTLVKKLFANSKITASCLTNIGFLTITKTFKKKFSRRPTSFQNPRLQSVLILFKIFRLYISLNLIGCSSYCLKFGNFETVTAPLTVLMFRVIDSPKYYSLLQFLGCMLTT